ncbi:MAG: hypothetical protein K2O01_05185 [Bacteroidales bacterium]|nr:hypothetical protein [Bacteroidales bacterium]
MIKTFAEDASVQVLNGRFGPYIACDKKNYKIDKKTDAASLPLAHCRAIIEAAEAAPATKRRAGARMAAAKAKTTKTPAKTSSAKTKTAAGKKAK